jgi:hypothetical protein
LSIRELTEPRRLTGPLYEHQRPPSGVHLGHLEGVRQLGRERGRALLVGPVTHLRHERRKRTAAASWSP